MNCPFNERDEAPLDGLTSSEVANGVRTIGKTIFKTTPSRAALRAQLYSVFPNDRTNLLKEKDCIL